MTQPFHGLFSAQAAIYAASRPRYPAELYAFLASRALRRRVVWDCATGNGQAAVDLTRAFDLVIATDVSARQIAHAEPARGVHYVVGTAEASVLREGAVDAVTVAQALHWLDIDAFAAEVRRVTAAGGIIAAWSYGSCQAGDDVDPLLRAFEFGTLRPYWNARRRWVDEGYRTISFPFEEIDTPEFTLRAIWTLPQLGAYLSSWSAVVGYRDATGTDPVRPLLEQLAIHWGSPDATREITWPLGVRVGRVG